MSSPATSCDGTACNATNSAAVGLLLKPQACIFRNRYGPKSSWHIHCHSSLPSPTQSGWKQKFSQVLFALVYLLTNSNTACPTMDMVLGNKAILHQILSRLTHPRDLSSVRNVSSAWRDSCRDYQQIVCGSGFHAGIRPHDGSDGKSINNDNDTLALCTELQRYKHSVKTSLLRLQVPDIQEDWTEDRRLCGAISMLTTLQTLSLIGKFDLRSVHLRYLPNTLQQLELATEELPKGLPLKHLGSLHTLVLNVSFAYIDCAF